MPWGLDVIVCIEDKGCGHTRVSLKSSIAALLRTKSRQQRQNHSYVTDKKSITHYGNISLLIPSLGIPPFMWNIATFGGQAVPAKRTCYS